MNRARFQRNQKVTIVDGSHVYTVTHPQPDDFNIVAIRRDDDQYIYTTVDQDNLSPVVPSPQLTVAWAIPTPGQYVLHQNTDGSYSIYTATHGDSLDSEVFVITNVTDKEPQ